MAKCQAWPALGTIYMHYDSKPHDTLTNHKIKKQSKVMNKLRDLILSLKYRKSGKLRGLRYDRDTPERV